MDDVTRSLVIDELFDEMTDHINNWDEPLVRDFLPNQIEIVRQLRLNFDSYDLKKALEALRGVARRLGCEKYAPFGIASEESRACGVKISN